jgi:hypothetical protein
LVSLFIGIVLGIIVASMFRLDLVQGVLMSSMPANPEDIPDAIKYTSPALRIIFTGVVVGLGSNPTHEVIRAVQEYKETQKGAQAGGQAETK